MTGLQVAILAGLLVGAAAVALVWRLVPAETDLADALARIKPQRTPTAVASQSSSTGDTQDRVGQWAIRKLPPRLWTRTPHSELAMLEIPLHRYYGQKVLYALLGLLIPPLLSVFFTLIGLQLPLLIPVAASLGLAAFMFLMPDLTVREEAGKARIEFTRALVAYIDLVALERNSGAGTRQAMESAATVGDSRPFQRLSEELARSQFSGESSWDAFRTLATELTLPELNDLADIMRLSGEHGAQVYDNLRARAGAMRDATLKADLAEANATGERMTIPMSMLGVVFMAILVAPGLLRMFQGAA